MICSSPCVNRSPTHAASCTVFATMLPWVSIAPLATPVVPPVYCRNAMSSWPSCTFGACVPAPRRSTSPKRRWPGSDQRGTIFFMCFTAKLTSGPLGNPSWSPIEVTITCSMRVLPIASCSVAAKFSSTTMLLAPESSSWCCSSRAVYSGLTLTTVKPARNAPNNAIGYCSRLGSMIARRSPLPSFHSFARKAAKRALCRSSSAQVRVFPKLEYAGRRGWRAHAASNMATIDGKAPASISAGTPGG